MSLCYVSLYIVCSMRVIPLLLYVIFQMTITKSLCGVVSPLSDFAGKVTPIKPKPLPPSIIPSCKSSSVCNTDDIFASKLLSATTGGSAPKEYSSPVLFTSSSRALPVPKTNLLSCSEVKLPDRLQDDFLPPKPSISFSRTLKPETCSPEISLPYNYPSLTQLSNVIPTYSSSDLLSKLSSSPIMKSLPNIPLQQVFGPDVLCSASKDNVVPLPSTVLPRPSVFESSLDTKLPLASEQLTSNVLPLSPSSSLPYPLYYKSMHLPGVSTPEVVTPMNYRPIPSLRYKNVCSSPSNSLNVLNLLSDTNNYVTLPYLNPLELSRPVNVPKPCSNVPLSTAIPKVQCPVDINYGSPLVSYKSVTSLPESVLSLISLSNSRCCHDLETSCCPICSRGGNYVYNYEQKPNTCLPIKPPTSCLSSINQPNFDFFTIPNCLNSIGDKKDVSCNFKYPIIGANVEYINIEDINCSDLVGYLEKSCNSQLTNVCETVKRPVITETPSLQYLSAPTSKIAPRVTDISPFIYGSPTTSQTPASYISCTNQSPSLAQTSSNIVSAVNKVVSGITQNILSSYTCYLNAILQHISKNTQSTITTNPYADPRVPPSQKLPLQQNIPSVLPTVRVPTNYKQPRSFESSSTSTLDNPYRSSSFEIPSRPSSISSPVLLPPPSLTTLPSLQICPSYLPSPRLPSYPALPVCNESPVIRIKSKRKDSDADKILELLLISDILSNDDTFDFDDLDALLALLTIS